MADHAESPTDTAPGTKADSATDAVAPQSDGLNPVQREVLGQLGATADQRPTFDDGLAADLRAHLDSVLAGLHEGPDAYPLTPDQRSRLPLWVAKHDLRVVHECEGLYVAESRQPFEWTVATAVGTIVHKAIELGVAWDTETAPRTLVDEAIASLTESPRSIGDWLYGLDERHRAELRGAAIERVSAFGEVMPPLDPRWRPVTETGLRAELGNGAVVLGGRVDLTLGRARGNVAGKVLVDYKTGTPRPHHSDDLRFYALLETLARGTPPRLLASLYLDAGQLRTERVTEDLLGVALRRTSDGAARIMALAVADQAPELSPGHHCRWCPANTTCDTGQAWLADQDADNPYALPDDESPDDD